MSFPNLNDLKRLTALCRKQGIVSFKYYQDGSYEFTLNSDYKPPSKKAEKKQEVIPNTDEFSAVEGESLMSDEQLLFWSSDSPLMPKENSEIVS